MHAFNRALTVIAACGICCTDAVARQAPQRGTAAGRYPVVKVCPLVSVAEVKKFAPWSPHLDQFAKAEEEALGTYGSSCNYPTLDVQVMAFSQQTIDSLNKSEKLERVAGVGDEAYVRNNRDNYAELFSRVGPHLLTLQMSIGTGQTFEGVKPNLIELSKLFVSRLRGK